MVAIFTGAGWGLERGSANLLGSQGQIGTAGLGRSGENVTVNAATGSLLVDGGDEMLIGRGPDQHLAMNYNSGVNGWLHNWIRQIFGLTGTVNTSGSTIIVLKEFGDRPVFSYDTARGAYVSKEGAGTYDEVRYSGGVWSLVDGDTGVTDYYELGTAGTFFRTRKVDRDGNTQTYTYNSSYQVTRITNADGAYTEFTYNYLSGSRPDEIRTYAAGGAGGGAPLTRVRYTWDTAVTASRRSPRPTAPVSTSPTTARDAF